MVVFRETLVDRLTVHSEPEIDLEAFVEALLDKTCEAVRNRAGVSAHDRSAFEIVAANIASRLKSIKEIADKQLRRVVLGAVADALAAGFYHAGNSGVVKELRAQLTKKARDVRRAEIEPKVQARREAIAAICNQKGWLGNEAKLSKMAARELEKLPELKGVKKSTRTVVNDLKVIFATQSELQQKP